MRRAGSSSVSASPGLDPGLVDFDTDPILAAALGAIHQLIDAREDDIGSGRSAAELSKRASPVGEYYSQARVPSF